MKHIYFLLIASVAFVMVGCSSHYPTNNIPAKTNFVPEEKPEKYAHPPEDLRSVVGREGWYSYGGYYYPSRAYYNRYSDYYRYRD